MKAHRAGHVHRENKQGHRRAITVITVFATVVAIAQSSSALSSQPPAQDATSDNNRAFAEAVAALDSDDWHARLDAAEYLRHANVLNKEIESLIDAPATSPEQRHQLLSILKLRVLERAAGAIGIQMSTTSMRNQMIVVDRLFTNMPAEQVLVPGDRITHINGRPILVVSEFRNTLRRLVPGDVVMLEIERVRSPDERNQADERAEPEALPESWNDVPRKHPPSQVEILQFEITLGTANSLGDSHMDDVWRERLDEVRMITLRHKPQSVPLFTANWRSNVDSHRVIKELLRQVGIYNELPVNERAMLIRFWKQTDQQLERGSIEAGLSREERTFRRDLLNRFRQLLPAGVMRNW